jgi:hypothetical protein
MRGPFCESKMSVRMKPAAFEYYRLPKNQLNVKNLVSENLGVMENQMIRQNVQATNLLIIEIIVRLSA